jgi:hypothetical protein
MKCRDHVSSRSCICRPLPKTTFQELRSWGRSLVDRSAGPYDVNAVVGGGYNTAYIDSQLFFNLVGGRDRFVVHTADVTMVCPVADAERVKELLAAVERRRGPRWS